MNGYGRDTAEVQEALARERNGLTDRFVIPKDYLTQTATPTSARLT